MLVRSHRALVLRASALLFAASCAVYDDRLTLPQAGNTPKSSAQTPQSIAIEPASQAGMTASTAMQPIVAATPSSAAGATAAGATAAPARGAPLPDEDAGTPPSVGQGAPSVPPMTTRVDRCPSDPLKLEPGLCGCGLPDLDTPAAASCSGLRAALRHRYPFDGTANVARDVRTEADAVIEGASLNGAGSLKLQDTNARQYVSLPAGLLTQLKDVSVEVWVQSERARTSETLFDFTDLVPDTTLPRAPFTPPPPTSRSALLLRTQLGTPRAALLVPGQSDVAVTAGQTLTLGRVTQLAVVVSGAEQRLSLYVDGKLIGNAAISASLAQVHDMNNWVGSSPAAPDVTFTGAFHELRIYDRALTPQQIATSWSAGPDPEYLQETAPATR